MDPILDRQALDTFLRSLPVHVLFFDAELICRYAAPDGSHFLGTPTDALIDRPVEYIFPAEVDLRPRLDRVLRTGRTWRSDYVPYPAGPDGAWPGGAWAVHARPLAVAVQSDVASARTGSHHPRSGHAVLVSCFERSDWSASALVERVRTKLTVIRGFAQLLRSRLRREQPRTNSTELDRISNAVVELDSLLTDFEDATRPG
jgi:nitrogen-specific signal transduction histidine kinase